MGESTATLSLVIRAKDLASREVKTLSGSLKSLAKDGLGGLNLPLLGVAGAVGLMTGALVKGIAGAIDEEKSLARLTTALKSNVPGWDGNTAAILEQVKARENLAFSDDQLRDSLGTLVAATHSVTRAQDLQRTAMDLARFKNIDLTAASEALVKVEGGQYRALKALGIVLKEGATQTEALAAVQAVTFGQAEAYASTTAGKMETAQIKINDAMEDLGARVLPLVAAAAEGVSATLDGTAMNTHVLAEQFLAAASYARQDLTPAMLAAAKSADTYSEAYAGLREASWGAASGLRGVAAANKLVAQTGQAALAAVQDEIDALKELEYIDRRTRSGRTSRGPSSTGIGGLGHGAEGGWFGLRGTETVHVGERRPEYVSNTHTPPSSISGEGLVIRGITQRDIIRMVDEGMYFRLQRKPS